MVLYTVFDTVKNTFSLPMTALTMDQAHQGFIDFNPENLNDLCLIPIFEFDAMEQLISSLLPHPEPLSVILQKKSTLFFNAGAEKYPSQAQAEGAIPYDSDLSTKTKELPSPSKAITAQARTTKQKTKNPNKKSKKTNSNS